MFLTRASFFVLLLSGMLVGLGVLCWVTGWDYTIQLWVAANDTQPWNNFWRWMSLLGLGKVQAAVCLLILFVYVRRSVGVSVIDFCRQASAEIIQLYITLWLGRAKLGQATRAWPLPAQGLLLAVPTLLVVGTICAALKVLIGRPRPKMFLWHDETAAHWLEGFLGRYQSMPSGHVMTTFALLAVLWPYFPRLRWALLAYGVISALSRVMAMTTHYVGDVLVGAGLGVGLAYWLVRRFNQPVGG